MPHLTCALKVGLSWELSVLSTECQQREEERMLLDLAFPTFSGAGLHRRQLWHNGVIVFLPSVAISN